MCQNIYLFIYLFIYYANYILSLFNIINMEDVSTFRLKEKLKLKLQTSNNFILTNNNNLPLLKVIEVHVPR
jgi:hypothetical protein